MKGLEPVGWLVLILALATSSSCQFVVYNGDAAQIVFTAQGLYAALQNTELPEIILSGNITLNKNTFPEPAIITNRSLLLIGDPGLNVTSELNFGGLSPAIVISDGADVTITNITLSGTGPVNITNPGEYEKYKTSGVASWPSLIVEAGTTVTFNETNSEFYSQIAWSRCANFAKKVKLQLDVAGYGPYTEQPSANTLRLRGDFNITANVTDSVTNTTMGTAFVRSINASGTCVTDPYPQDQYITGQSTANQGSGGGFKWWMGLIIGLVVLVALLVAGLALWIHRARRRQRLPVSQPDSKVSTEPNGIQSSRTHANDGGISPSPPGSSAQGSGGRAGDTALQDPVEVVAALPGKRSSTETRGSSVGAIGSNQSGQSNHSNLATHLSDVAAVLRARSNFSDIEVGPLIGRGSFGRVYKGKWKGAFVAIKIVDHQEAASKVMALREGSLSSSVQHPNVVTTYALFLQKLTTDAGSPTADWEAERKAAEDGDGDSPEHSGDAQEEEAGIFATCLILEYMDRGTLEEALNAGKFRDSTGRPNLRAIHRTLLDIAGGMDYLHSVGVLHGDLKGANVLLKSTSTDPRGFTCKLGDFGMARLLDGDRTHVSTVTYGTISYMPAELLKEGKLTRATDSYSFAILMWELFEGKTLHDGLTMAQVFYKVCYEEARPPVPEHMPSGYEDLMQACWHEDPQQRPSSREIFRRLQAIQGNKENSGDLVGLATSISNLRDIWTGGLKANEGQGT